MAATLVTQIGLPRSGMYRNILGALEIIGRKLGYGLDTAVSGASNLFFNAEQGVWYDPSDFSTLFQDSAGTTPVTAVGQPVGLILDKSGRGNHATQATAASRPVLSARVNLLTWSEDLSQWSKSSTTVTLNTTLAPDGTISADTALVAASTSGGTWPHTNGSYVVVAASTQYTLSWWAKRSGMVNVAYRVYNQSNGTNIIAPTSYYSQINSAGFVRISVSFTTPVGCLLVRPYIVSDDSSGQDCGAIVWGAQLETGSTATRYQSITTATSYDTVGFKQYLNFDGVDDNEATTTGGGATTAFFWCSSIKAGNIGAAQTLFSDTGTNTGYLVRINAGNQLELSAGDGAAYTTIATVPTLAVGQHAVLTAWDDGVNLNVQIDSGAVASVARPAVSAGTAAITIGKDNGAASSFFLGSIYEKIYVKDDVQTAAQIASAKAFCASKAGVTL